MSDIAAFIEARLADDQAAAESVQIGLAPVDDPLIALFTPARVLREVAAKRAMLARHRIMRAGESYWFGQAEAATACHGCGTDRNEEATTPDINDCPELRDLAAVWSDHPDYRPEWSPDATEGTTT